MYVCNVGLLDEGRDYGALSDTLYARDASAVYWVISKHPANHHRRGECVHPFAYPSRNPRVFSRRMADVAYPTKAV